LKVVLKIVYEIEMQFFCTTYFSLLESVDVYSGGRFGPNVTENIERRLITSVTSGDALQFHLNLILTFDTSVNNGSLAESNIISTLSAIEPLS
jgi:hypothetical protein